MNKISSLIQTQVPSYANEEYPIYVSFMESYYKWMEQDGNVLSFLENYQTNLDVDLADVDFIKEYLEEFVEFIPTNRKINDATLIKYIKEFYLAKGSEQSFKFLFTILFNENVDIIYPRDVMFRASDGTWDGDIFLKITNTNFNKLDLSNPDVNIKVVGRKSGAVAIVDTIKPIIDGNLSYTELELSSYSKDFIVDEKVNLHVNNFIVIERTIGGVVDLEIIDGGSGNKINDSISLTSSGTGFGFDGKVKGVTVGELDRYSIINAGQGYVVGDFVYAQHSSNDEGFGYIGEISKVGINGEIEAIDNISSGSLYNTELYVNIDSTLGANAVIKLQGDNVGKIESINILDSGYGYDPDSTYTIQQENGNIINIKPKIGCIFSDIKGYKDVKGFPSYNSVIQDSYYYQIFSYALKSKVRPDLWKGLVKKIAHPAGTELFAIWENVTAVYTGMDGVSSDYSYVFKIISEIFAEPNTTISNVQIIKELNNIESCPSFLGVNDLDEIKFSDNFTWSIEEFEQLSLIDLANLCYSDLYLTNDTEITIT